MTTLNNSPITEEELKKKVFKYAASIFNKHEYVSHWHVLTITRDIPEEQRWPDQKDFPFIRECLLKYGVGKISELKEYNGEKEKPGIPFHMLPSQKPDDPRDYCAECDICGNQGCPQHRETIRNLSA